LHLGATEWYTALATQLLLPRLCTHLLHKSRCVRHIHRIYLRQSAVFQRWRSDRLKLLLFDLLCSLGRRLFFGLIIRSVQLPLSSQSRYSFQDIIGEDVLLVFQLVNHELDVRSELSLVQFQLGVINSCHLVTQMLKLSYVNSAHHLICQLEHLFFLSAYQTVHLWF
jgi:hypothetical protein